jgi:hypothetical protein
MATLNVTVPDTLRLGRNGAIGELQVDWSKVPQGVLDHIATVYFPQYITDAANAGGKDEDATSRMARAQKKLDAMYAGLIRTRGEGAEPIDPVEREAFRLAKAELLTRAKGTPEWKNIDKSIKGDDRLQECLDVRADKVGRERTDWADVIGTMLEKDPEFTKRAKAIVAQRSKTSTVGDDLI